MQLTGTRKTLKRRIDALRRESTTRRSPEHARLEQAISDPYRWLPPTPRRTTSTGTKKDGLPLMKLFRNGCRIWNPCSRSSNWNASSGLSNRGT